MKRIQPERKRKIAEVANDHVSGNVLEELGGIDTQEGGIGEIEEEAAKQNQRKGNVRNQYNIVLFTFLTFNSYKKTARFVRAPKCIRVDYKTIIICIRCRQ